MTGEFSRRRRPGLRESLVLLTGLAALVLQGVVAAHALARTPENAACAGKVDTSLRGTTSATADVLVVGRSGPATAAAVSRAGGRIVADEPMISGVRARVPAAHLASMACSSAIISVSPNRAVHFQSTTSDATVSGSTASDFVKSTNATAFWKAGLTGKVGVAVIDTGISPMDDLAGRVVYGPDLSGEGTIIDSFGHGTVMAGIIGGNGKDSASSTSAGYTGMAPDATLISVKVAGRNGATDVSTVLEAMHWVSAYKNQFNIRVLNLSWGTPSTQSPTVDPLDYAVERLWKQGIVVVVAAGNGGPRAGTILKPADDPLVLTVGAYDDGEASGPSGDSVPEWTSVGPTAAGYAKPDLVAPGRTLIAQRSYGSLIEADNPNALVAPSYIKGSGTSQAAAVASGAAALLLQARPSLTPDQVKFILTSNARPLPGVSDTVEGAGRLDIGHAGTAAAGPAVQQTPVASGLGSLELSRGGRHVQVDCGEDGTPDVVVGEMTADCQQWDPAAWTGSSWTGSSWTGSSWTGSSWTGSSWTGSSWTGSSWTGSSWTGGTWTGSSWTGSSWTGSSWTGSSWTGSSWTGSSWTGSSWTGSSWTGSSWTGRSWTGSSWTGRSWTGSSWTGSSWADAGWSTDEPNDFLTLWWGDAPARNLHVPGERPAH
jgi:serine protease AprX